MKPIHKFNGGNGSTLCHRCRSTISTGFTNDLYCSDLCKLKHRDKESYDNLYEICTQTVRKHLEDYLKKRDK